MGYEVNNAGSARGSDAAELISCFDEVIVESLIEVSDSGLSASDILKGLMGGYIGACIYPKQYSEDLGYYYKPLEIAPANADAFSKGDGSIVTPEESLPPPVPSVLKEMSPTSSPKDLGGEAPEEGMAVEDIALIGSLIAVGLSAFSYLIMRIKGGGKGQAHIGNVAEATPSRVDVSGGQPLSSEASGRMPALPPPVPPPMQPSAVRKGAVPPPVPKAPPPKVPGKGPRVPLPSPKALADQDVIPPPIPIAGRPADKKTGGVHFDEAPTAMFKKPDLGELDANTSKAKGELDSAGAMRPTVPEVPLTSRPTEPSGINVAVGGEDGLRPTEPGAMPESFGAGAAAAAQSEPSSPSKPAKPIRPVKPSGSPRVNPLPLTDVKSGTAAYVDTSAKDGSAKKTITSPMRPSKLPQPRHSVTSDGPTRKIDTNTVTIDASNVNYAFVDAQVRLERENVFVELPEKVQERIISSVYALTQKKDLSPYVNREGKLRHDVLETMIRSNVSGSSGVSALKASIANVIGAIGAYAGRASESYIRLANEIVHHWFGMEDLMRIDVHMRDKSDRGVIAKDPERSIDPTPVSAGEKLKISDSVNNLNVPPISWVEAQVNEQIAWEESIRGAGFSEYEGENARDAHRQLFADDWFRQMLPVERFEAAAFIGSKLNDPSFVGNFMNDRGYILHEGVRHLFDGVDHGQMAMPKAALRPRARAELLRTFSDMKTAINMKAPKIPKGGK